MPVDQQADQFHIQSALTHARDTRRLALGCGELRQTGRLAQDLFPGESCLIVADENTFAAAGRGVYDSLVDAGVDRREPLVLPAEGLYAEYSFVDRVREAIRDADAVPIAVGAGTVNDLVKLATHQCGRRYVSVATAASMDGYTAYGASITREGSKQTFDCPAPLGVVADLDVIAAAPAGMNAAGYADLLAKCSAGADWLLADGLGVDLLDPVVWPMVQRLLRRWLENPAGVPNHDATTTRRLTVALMMTGFAMQAAQTSRPASGAEHQFSHLWDMEGHTYSGRPVSHGFKVGIGTIASLGLYEALLAADLQDLDVDAAVNAWPDGAENAREIDRLFPAAELAAKAHQESGAKHASPAELRAQLQLLAERWPAIRGRLQDQVMPQREAADRLRAAGCPSRSDEIGVSAERLRGSFPKAYHIRRRYTALDLARRTNLLGALLDATNGRPRKEACP